MKKLKTAGLLLAAPLLVGAMVAWLVPARPLEEELQRVELAQSTLQIQAMHAQYPGTAPRVYALYGQAPDFHETLRRYGHNQVVPIIDKCFDRGDRVIEVMGRLQQLVQALPSVGTPPAPGSGFRDWAARATQAITGYRPPAYEPITPEQCGWLVVQMTLASGNDFLGQFVVTAEGAALRLPGTTTFALAKQLLTSGVQVLERRAVLGERPTPAEWLMGGADMVGFAGVWKVLTLHAGKAAALKASAGFAGTSAAVTTTKLAVVGGVAYLTFNHPGLVLSTITAVGEQLGLPRWLAEALGVGIALFVVSLILFWLLRPMVWLCRTMAGFFRKKAPLPAK